MIYKLPSNQGTSEEMKMGCFFSSTSINGCASWQPSPPPAPLLSVASWCNVRNSNHVRLWHWQPWHSQQRDKKERKAERPRRGKGEKAAEEYFFLAHKFHSYKIPNVLDILHPRKIEDGARWILMEMKLAWEDFVLPYFPCFVSFEYVAYVIVTVALIASHQGKKGIKFFFPFPLPKFFSFKQSKVKHPFQQEVCAF